MNNQEIDSLNKIQLPVEKLNCPFCESNNSSKEYSTKPVLTFLDKPVLAICSNNHAFGIWKDMMEQGSIFKGD